MDRLVDRTAIVTGSSSGLGRAIALRFAAEGAKVVAVDQRRDPDRCAGNNAATYVSKPLLETTRAEWEHVFAVNLTAVFDLSRLVVGHMLSQEPRDGVRGRIVNISSQHGMVAAPLDIAYGTSKSGVVYITRQIATDYGPQGIVCNAVAPGKIMTGKGGHEDDPEWVDGGWSAS